MGDLYFDIPNDATGDALRRMLNDGADLSKPHEVDFYIAAPNAKAGELIVAQAYELGFDVELNKDEDGSEWTCRCTKTMVPTYIAISRIESQLDSMSKEFSGRADGWGAFSVS